ASSLCDDDDSKAEASELGAVEPRRPLPASLRESQPWSVVTATAQTKHVRAARLRLRDNASA
ncbi:MAG: hypothetical protein ACM3ZE_15090, partial [Myxococcales bacterium]